MSTTTEDRRAERNEALRRILEPELGEIDAKLEDVAARMDALREEREALRAERTDTVAMLRRIDPDNPAYAATMGRKPGQKAKPKPGDGRLVASMESQDKVEEWLRAHSDNGLESGFYAGGIMKHPAVGELGLSRATVQAALKNLAERGILRLDRMAVPEGSRGSAAHIYKLTS